MLRRALGAFLVASCHPTFISAQTAEPVYETTTGVPADTALRENLLAARETGESASSAFQDSSIVMGDASAVIMDMTQEGSSASEQTGDATVATDAAQEGSSASEQTVYTTVATDAEQERSNASEQTVDAAAATDVAQANATELLVVSDSLTTEASETELLAGSESLATEANTTELLAGNTSLASEANTTELFAGNASLAAKAEEDADLDSNYEDLDSEEEANTTELLAGNASLATEAEEDVEDEDLDSEDEEAEEEDAEDKDEEAEVHNHDTTNLEDEDDTVGGEDVEDEEETDGNEDVEAKEDAEDAEETDDDGEDSVKVEEDADDSAEEDDDAAAEAEEDVEDGEDSKHASLQKWAATEDGALDNELVEPYYYAYYDDNTTRANLTNLFAGHGAYDLKGARVDDKTLEAEAVTAMMASLAKASPQDVYLAALSSDGLPEQRYVGDQEEHGDIKVSLWKASEDFDQTYELDEAYYYRYYRHDRRTMEPQEGFGERNAAEKDWGALESPADTSSERDEAYYYQYRVFAGENEKVAKVLSELRKSDSEGNEDASEGAEKPNLRGSLRKEPELGQIDLVMLSDRQVGAAASLQSVCSNSVDASRLNLHIIGPTEQGKWTLDALAPACAAGRAKMHLYSLDEMTQRVEGAGFFPIWKWPPNGASRSPLSVHPASWDNSSTHKDPFNLLRFYLPHIEPFSELSKLIFMDDDVIINRDVAEAWDFQLRNGTIMSASCHNWIWSNCDRFRSGTEFSYLDVPYFGFGHIGLDRTVEDATCAADDQEECAPAGFMEMLRNQSVEINGESRQLTMKFLRQSKAWNYGFNKFDLDAWRANNITQRFLRWMQVNHDIKMFPETSLAYGLGIAMLTKIGRVHCFPPEYDVIQGLGFVGTYDMHNAGINGTGLRRAFGFHFNGPKKPWEHSAGNPFSSYFLAYSQPEVQSTFSDKAREHRVKRTQQEAKNATSFVVFTDPRSGSEWFMDLLDHHPQLCASGEADDGASSFPREALIPGRYMKGDGEEDPPEEEEELNMTMLEDWNETMLFMNETMLLQIEGGEMIGETVISDEERQKMWDMDLLPPPSERELSLLLNHSEEDEDERRQFADGSLNSCQAKASCSWGSIARHVWRVCLEGERLCTPQRLEKAFYHKQGINRYLGVVCHLRSDAIETMKAKDVSNPRLLFSEVFKVYFRHMTRHSLSLNDATFGTFREARQILPCRCPKQAVMHGQKLMHDWMGDLPLTGWAASQWKESPYGINYNADEASLVMDLPYVDMLGAMAEAGTKAIMFERKNLLARYVSIRTANQTAIFHCASDDCVKVAQKVKIFVDVPRFRGFVAWTNRRHQENRDLVAKYGIDMLELVYEECVANSQMCLYKVCNFLNVTAPEVELHDEGKQVKVMGKLAKHIENIDEVTQALTEDGLLHYLDE